MQRPLVVTGKPVIVGPAPALVVLVIPPITVVFVVPDSTVVTVVPPMTEIPGRAVVTPPIIVVKPPITVFEPSITVVVPPTMVVIPPIIVLLPPTGGTETDPPPGHHDGSGAQVGPGLPSVTPLAGEGARTAKPLLDSKSPLNEEMAKA